MSLDRGTRLSEGKAALIITQLETKEAAAQASKPRSDEDEQPSSVIHAPQGFDAFVRKFPFPATWP